MNPDRLYRLHELAWRTQYAELGERVRSAGPVLPGTPGTLYERSGSGRPYVYRVYYSVPGVQAEELVGPASDHAATAAARARLDFAQWVAEQTGHLRKLGFQVADKATARVLVELHNRGLFAAGLVVTGTLAYLGWLNELGVAAAAQRTLDVDLARPASLKLSGTVSLREALQQTRLPFAPVPGMPSHSPSTSLKLPGREGLRIDLLAPGRSLGAAVALPELAWHAQSVPHYAWLLESSGAATLLAGGHAIPVRLPDAARFCWHKLYSSAARAAAPAKAAKDLLQAATLAAVIAEQGETSLGKSLRGAPPALLAALRRRLPALLRQLSAHPQAAEQASEALR